MAEDNTEDSPYTYCSNNQILHIDIDGEFSLVANVGGIVGGAVGGIAGSYVGGWIGTSSVDMIYGY